MRARERRFVAELLRGGTPAEAASRAGYAAASARDAARRLLAKPVVRYAVERGRTQVERRTGVTRERVLEELARIAFANLGRVGDWDGERLTLASLGELGAAEAAAISTLTIYRSKGKPAVAVRFHAKAQAIAALARYFGLNDGPKAPQKSGRERLMERLKPYLDAAEREEREERERAAGGEK
jgi:phage terminase small subunit